MKSSVLQNTLNKGRYEERERKKGRVSRLNASMTFCLFLCCIDSRWKTRPYIINSRKSAVILQQAMHIIWRKLYFSAASRDSTGSCGQSGYSAQHYPRTYSPRPHRRQWKTNRWGLCPWEAFRSKEALFFSPYPTTLAFHPPPAPKLRCPKQYSRCSGG